MGGQRGWLWGRSRAVQLARLGTAWHSVPAAATLASASPAQSSLFVNNGAGKIAPEMPLGSALCCLNASTPEGAGLAVAQRLQEGRGGRDGELREVPGGIYSPLAHRDPLWKGEGAQTGSDPPSGPHSLAMPHARDVSPEGCESWGQFWEGQHCLVLAQNSCCWEQGVGPYQTSPSHCAGTLLWPWGCDFQLIPCESWLQLPSPLCPSH